MDNEEIKYLLENSEQLFADMEEAKVLLQNNCLEVLLYCDYFSE